METLALSILLNDTQTTSQYLTSEDSSDLTLLQAPFTPNQTLLLLQAIELGKQAKIAESNSKLATFWAALELLKKETPKLELTQLQNVLSSGDIKSSFMARIWRIQLRNWVVAQDWENLRSVQSQLAENTSLDRVKLIFQTYESVLPTKCQPQSSQNDSNTVTVQDKTDPNNQNQIENNKENVLSSSPKDNTESFIQINVDQTKEKVMIRIETQSDNNLVFDTKMKVAIETNRLVVKSESDEIILNLALNKPAENQHVDFSLSKDSRMLSLNFKKGVKNQIWRNIFQSEAFNDTHEKVSILEGKSHFLIIICLKTSLQKYSYFHKANVLSDNIISLI